MRPNEAPLFEQQVAPGGTITGTGAPFPPTGYSSYQEPQEEPEPVRYVTAITYVDSLSDAQNNPCAL